MMNQRIGRWHYGVLCRRKSQQVEPNRCSMGHPADVVATQYLFYTTCGMSPVSKISIERPIHIETDFRGAGIHVGII
jgi:hypothetical protein